MQTRPWEFGVKETPAREWSEGMGSLIAVAMFFGGIAGGLYLASLYFNNIWGMFIAWIFAMGMGLFDMAHLSKPARVWRIAFRAGFFLDIPRLHLRDSFHRRSRNPVAYPPSYRCRAAEPTAAEVFFRVWREFWLSAWPFTAVLWLVLLTASNSGIPP